MGGGKKILVKFYFADVIAPYHYFPLDLAVTVIVTMNCIYNSCLAYIHPEILQPCLMQEELVNFCITFLVKLL